MIFGFCPAAKIHTYPDIFSSQVLHRAHAISVCCQAELAPFCGNVKNISGHNQPGPSDQTMGIVPWWMVICWVGAFANLTAWIDIDRGSLSLSESAHLQYVHILLVLFYFFSAGGSMQSWTRRWFANLHLILTGWENRTDTPLCTRHNYFWIVEWLLRLESHLGSSCRASEQARVAPQVWGGLTRMLQRETSPCMDCSSVRTLRQSGARQRQNTEWRLAPRAESKLKVDNSSQKDNTRAHTHKHRSTKMLIFIISRHI